MRYESVRYMRHMISWWFMQSVLLPTNILSNEGGDEDTLPDSISITRIDDLLGQMRFHEAPMRAVFSVGLELTPGFRIGVKG
jgi:ATP-dependent DNA helicase 2 subunit 1